MKSEVTTKFYPIQQYFYKMIHVRFKYGSLHIEAEPKQTRVSVFLFFWFVKKEWTFLVRDTRDMIVHENK